MEIHSSFPNVAIPDAVSLPDFIFAQIGKYADDVALLEHETNRQLTYRHLFPLCSTFAASMQARGLKKGDVLALFTPNLPEFAIVFLGIAMAGGVLTTANPAYTANELGYLLRNSNAKWIVTVPSLLPVLNATGCNLDEVLVIGECAGATPLHQLLHPQPHHSFKPVPINPKVDFLVLPYSSGTTSHPKAVCLTHYNLIANVLQLSHPAIFDVVRNDTILGLLPFFHIYGMVVMLLAGLYHGAKIVTLPKFIPEVFLQALEKHRITIAQLAPPVILFLAKDPTVAKYDLSSLRSVLSGAAPLGQELAETFVSRLKCSLRQGYGMTEMSPVSHTLRLKSTKYASIGCLVPNMVMKIVDVETGEPVPCGSQGEFLLKGPNVMQGYLNNPEATAATIDKDGFLHTGDVGYMDADGDCFIVDRCKELIKVKGFQVAPAELEDLLHGHPAVGDCAVIGVRRGEDEAPKAFVVLNAGHHSSVELGEEIISFVAKSTAPFKRIKEICFISQVPKSASGKILRRELRAMDGKEPTMKAKL